MYRISRINVAASIQTYYAIYILGHADQNRDLCLSAHERLPGRIEAHQQRE
jgi:Na+/melibiose symporter-like transporter